MASWSRPGAERLRRLPREKWGELEEADLLEPGKTLAGVLRHRRGRRRVARADTQGAIVAPEPDPGLAGALRLIVRSKLGPLLR